jgi:hypothetical protein
MEAKGWTQANGLDLPPLTWLRYRWLRLSRQPLVGGGMLRARAVADVQQPATMGDDKMQRAPVRHACDVLSRLASLPHSRRRRVSPQPDTARHSQTQRLLLLPSQHTVTCTPRPSPSPSPLPPLPHYIHSPYTTTTTTTESRRIELRQRPQPRVAVAALPTPAPSHRTIQAGRSTVRGRTSLACPALISQAAHDTPASDRGVLEHIAPPKRPLDRYCLASSWDLHCALRLGANHAPRTLSSIR